MNVKIKYYGIFKDITNLSEEILEPKETAPNLKSVVSILSERYGSRFKDTILDMKTDECKGGMVILINELKGDLDQEIGEGDVISFFQMVTGG